MHTANSVYKMNIKTKQSTEKYSAPFPTPLSDTDCVFLPFKCRPREKDTVRNEKQGTSPPQLQAIQIKLKLVLACRIPFNFKFI